MLRSRHLIFLTETAPLKRLRVPWRAQDSIWSIQRFKVICLAAWAFRFSGIETVEACGIVVN
jgi:hypothetical protein